MVVIHPWIEADVKDCQRSKSVLPGIVSDNAAQLRVLATNAEN